MKFLNQLVSSCVLFHLLHYSLVKSDALSMILRQEDLLKEISALTIDLLSKIKAGHCYTLITDPLYSEILQSKLFHQIDRTSHFVIEIPFNEDMSMPENETVTVLSEAHKSGCQCYLIYFANGIQMARFLRFIDRYRIIDTRAKLIVLHDYRLFVPRMHFIWKRFINVIFIRESEPTMRKNRTLSATFELLTVPYPFPIKEIFVSKHLDLWRNGHYRRGVKLDFDKTRNLEGQPIRTVILQHTPGVSVENNSLNDIIYSGIEIEILRAIAKTMNFSTNLYETEDAAREKWGSVSPNGSYTGILGEMIKGVAGIALGDLYYTPYHLEIMDLSIPYTAQCLTFLTPESLTDNSWQTLILPFSADMWGSVLFFLFCVGFIFYILDHTESWINQSNNDLSILPIKASTKSFFKQFFKQKLEQKKAKINAITNKLIIDGKIFVPKVIRRRKDIFASFGNCILYTYSMLLVVSLPRLPKSWPIRLLTGWYWAYCLSIVAAYRASLTAILANPAPRLTIDTLKELAYSPITCGVWGERNRDFFQTSADETSQKIGTKTEIINDADKAIERISQGKFAYYENEYFLQEMQFYHDQRPENKEKYLHIMKECAINMPISIGLEKNSPLKPQFDKLLRQIMESGLISKWLADTIQKFESSSDDPPKEALMDLKKLYGILIALVTGFSVALLVLIGEILYWKFITQKSPLYDKYALIKLYQYKRI